MSKAEILAELPKRKPKERHEVLEKIYQLDRIEDEWLDADDPLTDAEQALMGLADNPTLLLTMEVKPAPAY